MSPPPAVTKVIATALSVLILASVIMVATLESMAQAQGLPDGVLFVGVLAACIGWVAGTTPNPRLRFELAFWGGMVFLTYAALLAWRTARGSFKFPRAYSPMIGEPTWLVLVVCAYCIFAGLLMILWAIRRP